MDFDLSEEQKMLKEMTRSFLVKECTKKLVRDMEEDAKGYSPLLWAKLAELGCMGLMLPAEYGGEGRSFLDFTILLEEVGRALMPGPFIPTVVYGALSLQHFGSDQQKKSILPGIARGKTIMTLALTDPSVDTLTRAVKEGGDYVISGTKLFVPDAHIADWLICVARTGRNSTAFLVDGKSQGLSFTMLKTLASDRQCEVRFDSVRVPAANVLGKAGQGREITGKIQDWGSLANAAVISGAIQCVLEMTVDYAKQRVQFDKPIGSFQAIQHQLADMLIDVDGARFLTYEAAWKLSRGLAASMDISCAKAWAGEASRRVCLMGHKIFGGVAQIKDHDMHLYFRRTKQWELALGDGDYHRELIAGSLGLN